MKTYNIPIIYQRVETMTVEADSLQDAMTKALDEFLSIPDEKYLDDSFEFDTVIEDYQEDFNTELAIQNTFK